MALSESDGIESAENSASSAAGLGLSIADLSKTATFRVSLLGRSFKAVPLLGNAISAVSGLEDIYGYNDLDKAFDHCMAETF
jgi:hypothetical protein